jgi:type 1 glutamine amidotransferase/glyoxylase-like metal-dependent hydrolase (beta-lactamase superfamily II)
VGSSHKHAAANRGWVAFDDHVVLIGAPDPDLIPDTLKQVAETTNNKPVRSVILTHVRKGEVESAAILASKGIDVIAEASAAKTLREAVDQAKPAEGVKAAGKLRAFADRLELQDAHHRLEVIYVSNAVHPGDSVVFLPEPQILFTGELCVNGPRSELPGTDTRAWFEALDRLGKLPARTVVPGFGTIGGPAILDRDQRFLGEIRRQVGHLVAQGRVPQLILEEVKIAPAFLVWMPYDQPVTADIEHVYRELTVPNAPFGKHGPSTSDPRPKALVMIGDSPHDPAHIEAGLRQTLAGAGLDAYFSVDSRALSAENLKHVQLLVMLRDGSHFPHGRRGAETKFTSWMTPEQERAIVDFVERGGGLLALHNSTGLYPDGGPYLTLLAGNYLGHGPLEIFRVTILNKTHPVTEGVSDFEVADEQHTPGVDKSRVEMLMENRSAEGIVGAAGWVRTQGKGRVCYLANGHTRDAQNHPECQRLIQNGARWCLGIENPK